MGRKKIKSVIDHAGQHLALSVAAHLARTELVRDPLPLADARLYADTLDALGSALLRVAPSYVLDTKSGQLRELAQEELKGASAKRAATALLLSDGRLLSGVFIKRTDLRPAIAILRALDIPEIRNGSRQHQNAVHPNVERAARFLELQKQLGEIEALLDVPLVPAQIDQAQMLAISLARASPVGRIAQLAMQLIDAVQEARNGMKPESVPATLALLRAALDEHCEDRRP